MDSILPTHRSRISHSLHGYRDGSSTLPALHQLHLDSTSPVRVPVMRHRWATITFLHWPYPAAEIQRRLPAGLEVEPRTATAREPDLEDPAGGVQLSGDVHRCRHPPDEAGQRGRHRRAGVDHEEIAGGEERRQLPEPAVLELASRGHEQPDGVPAQPSTFWGLGRVAAGGPFEGDDRAHAGTVVRRSAAR